MAEPGDGAGARFGQMLVGGLKLVGGKVVDFGGTVAGKVVDVGGTVGRSVVDVGRQVVDLKLFESDFERMRQLNQLAKQQQDLRRKYTEQELAAVEARADLVLGQLYTGYFEANFDPVAYELAKLGDNDGQEQIDELVERLTQGVEVRLWAAGGRARQGSSAARPGQAIRNLQPSDVPHHNALKTLTPPSQASQPAL